MYFMFTFFLIHVRVVHVLLSTFAMLKSWPYIIYITRSSSFQGDFLSHTMTQGEHLCPILQQVPVKVLGD